MRAEKENPTVFLVEDDEAAREALSIMLETSGFEVQAFSSGESLLHSYRRTPASCLVCDLNLPDTDGLSLQAEVARRHGAVPFVIITGRGDDDDRSRAIAAGAVAFFNKPLKKQTFVAALLDAVAAPR